jgi:hypothetical protein
MKRWSLGIVVTAILLVVEGIIGVSGVARAASGSSNVASNAKCKSLADADFSSIQDAPTQITAAKIVPAEGGEPTYCQVQGYIAPQVGFELRLPTSNWNGKFIEIGCGGACGTTDWLHLVPGTQGLRVHCLGHGTSR